MDATTPTMEVYKNNVSQGNLMAGLSHTGFWRYFFGRLTSLQRKPTKSIWNSLFFFLYGREIQKK